MLASGGRGRGPSHDGTRSRGHAVTRSLIILYRSLINGNAQRVDEHLQFGADITAP